MNRLGARDGRRVKTSTAGHASSGSGSPRQRSGVFLSVVNEDQPSGWHATAIPHGRLPLSPGGPKRKRRTRGSGLTAVGSRGCLRCLLLVMCTHPFAKKAFTLHLSRSEGHERYFGCNLMHRKALASSHQHLMAEAP